MSTYDDEGYLTGSFEPPPWWGEEVQAVVEGIVLQPPGEADPFEGREFPVADDTEEQPAPAEPQLSPREQSARRLTAIAALEKLLAKLKAQEKGTGVWTGEGQKETVKLPTGEKLGHARTDAVKAAWTVADKGKWLAYVTRFAPAHLVEVTTTEVDPTWQAYVLKQLLDPKAEQWFVDPDTGVDSQTPPPAAGLKFTPAGHKLVVVPDPGAAAAVEKFLGPVAQQLGLPELEAD